MEKKRDRMSFSMEKTFQILKEVENHRGTRVEQAKKLGLSVSTLNTIIKSKHKITEAVNGPKC